MTRRSISLKRPARPLRRTSGSTERMLDVLRQFRVVIRTIKRHYQWVEQRCGVSGAQLWAMERIAATRGLTPGDLARELAIHPRPPATCSRGSRN